MKYSFKKINIESPFPTTQCGHSSQVNELFEYHDHLYARVVSFKDDNSISNEASLLHLLLFFI